MSQIPDNYDAYRQYERDKERDEYFNDKLSGIEGAISDIIAQSEDYDPDSCEDMQERLEKIHNIVGKISNEF
jgi:hypothetical protein